MTYVPSPPSVSVITPCCTTHPPCPPSAAHAESLRRNFLLVSQSTSSQGANLCSPQTPDLPPPDPAHPALPVSMPALVSFASEQLRKPDEHLRALLVPRVQSRCFSPPVLPVVCQAWYRQHAGMLRGRHLQTWSSKLECFCSCFSSTHKRY